jgi:hypothetical protein
VLFTDHQRAGQPSGSDLRNLGGGRAAKLAAAILADRNRKPAESSHNIVECFACGYTFMYAAGASDLNGRYCSRRCQDWHDAGNPMVLGGAEQKARYSDVQLEAWKVTAGPPDLEVGSSYYAAFLAEASKGGADHHHRPGKRSAKSKLARKRRPAIYTVQINGHGVWQPGAELRRMGFERVDCGFDGPEARAAAAALDADAALRFGPETRAAAAALDASTDLRANHAQKGQ